MGSYSACEIVGVKMNHSERGRENSAVPAGSHKRRCGGQEVYDNLDMKIPAGGAAFGAACNCGSRQQLYARGRPWVPPPRALCVLLLPPRRPSQTF